MSNADQAPLFYTAIADQAPVSYSVMADKENSLKPDLSVHYDMVDLGPQSSHFLCVIADQAPILYSVISDQASLSVGD